MGYMTPKKSSFSFMVTPPTSQMTNTSKKAFLTFKLFDKDKKNVLSIDKFPDLIEELGEGFYGDELKQQIDLIDPSQSGSFTKDAFVTWYNNFLLDNDNSEDDEEIEEAKLEAMEKFENTAFDCGVSTRDYIPFDTFSKLIKALGATYCEEEHGKIGKKLNKNDKIWKEDFIVWYIDWLFGDEEDDDDE